MQKEKKDLKKSKKSLRKQIKEINRSLVTLAPHMQNELSVSSVHFDDSVFLCKDGTFKKIYRFRPAALGDKRTAFIKSLTDRFKNRIRFTICFKNFGDSTSSHMFMTVSFNSKTYYEVRKEIAEFESQILKEICVFLKISIVTCSVENVLSFINFMFTGEMRQYSPDFLSDKESSGLVPELKDKDKGFFSSGNLFGVSFVGKNILKPLDDVNSFSLMKKGTYYFVLDVQSFESEAEHTYSFDLRSRYSVPLDNEDYSGLINMSYFFTYLSDSNDETKALYNKSFDWFDSKGIYLMPGIGKEKEIFYSSCLFGLSVFQISQISSCNVIGSLLF